jgi:MFS superfamily sulfate permease-like transporter
MARTPIGQRILNHGVGDLFTGVTRANAGTQLLAGLTLVAVAIPEQLATAQLAGVPAFVALMAFYVASVVMVLVGSNPILSVGADSTIAPIFAVSLGALAPLQSSHYAALTAATALLTGLLVVVLGAAKLGWLADFLSVPIISGFMAGVGVIIIVHQLPHVIGIVGVGGSTWHRVANLVAHLSATNGWTLGIALLVAVVLIVGDRLRATLPWALTTLLVAALVARVADLSRHGVALVGTVHAVWPSWRLSGLSLHEWAGALTTALTLFVVVVSQTAATSRNSADELGVAVSLDRDFVGVGLANMAAGLVGAIPVNASPARTTLARVAGASSKLATTTALVIGLVLTPWINVVRFVPTSALAGLLLFVAWRLMRLDTLRRIWRSSREEFALAVAATLGVVIVGVVQGLAIAVGLAIVAQTWRSSRATMVELGRRKGTTSWEPIALSHVHDVDHVLVVLFTKELFFANAGQFRRTLHDHLRTHDDVRALVIDAVAMTDVDYTGMATLAGVVDDLHHDGVRVALARASSSLRHHLTASPEERLRHVALYDSVDEAVRALS